MRKKVVKGIFFMLVSLLMLGVPVSMIIRREGVITGGREFKFRTAPVDPFDAFRGRYVALSLKAFRDPVYTPDRLSAGQKVYAWIETGPQGFAIVSKATAAAPQGVPYLVCWVLETMGSQVFLRPSLDRYYMEESKAALAERLYRHFGGGQESDAYITVMIDAGTAVIRKLYVGGKPIEDLIRDSASEKGVIGQGQEGAVSPVDPGME